MPLPPLATIQRAPAPSCPKTNRLSCAAAPLLPALCAVAAGATHPLYLTSSEVGGGSYSGFANETVYAGGDESLGECRLRWRLLCLLFLLRRWVTVLRCAGVLTPTSLAVVARQHYAPWLTPVGFAVPACRPARCRHG